jgi:hypothetical protein
VVWAGLALALTAIVVEAAHLTVLKDPLAQVRADATSAVQALDNGDLPALEKTLSANRGQVDFAYFFTAKATPRALGDALATVAGSSEEQPLKVDVDAHAYDVTLVDLAGTLALASYGTGDRALPASWTSNFITATTTPTTLYAKEHRGRHSAPDRADQDAANKQNLLLLLSRGYWSTRFLKAVAAAYWTFDHDKSEEAWHSRASPTAKYAPAPTGRYLTDGILALTAALTTNPAASAWAFRDFQPGNERIDGSHYEIGKFSHYLLLEHRFPEPTDAGSVGMTASLTALSSAITAIRGEVAARPRASDASGSEGTGPLRDSIVLQSLARDLTDGGCSWNPRHYWTCATAVAEAAGRWVQHWGHELLDILSLGTFAPPPFTVVAIGAAATNATWYAIEGDYGKAGLSLAAAVPGLAFTKLAEGAKAGATAERAAAQADEIARTARASRMSVVLLTDRELAEAGAVNVVRGSPRFRLEADARDGYVRQHPGSTPEKSIRLHEPDCLADCLGARRVDVLESSGKAVEIKIGINNDEYAMREIKKDLALLQDKSSGVKSLEWNFHQDSKGIIGPSRRIREALKANRIPYVMHVA